MAPTRRSDVIIPEVFVPYVVQATTNLDRFLQSGVVQPLAELNAGEGDFINVPFWGANLAGDQEVLTDSTSLTPGKISTGKQIAVQLHRGRAFEARDLASIAAGSDAMAAIGNKLAAYIANQKQKDLLAGLEGCFGSLNANDSNSAFFSMCVDSESGDSPTVLSPRTVAAARAKFPPDPTAAILFSGSRTSPDPVIISKSIPSDTIIIASRFLKYLSVRQSLANSTQAFDN